jgi:hypothetical protein
MIQNIDRVLERGDKIEVLVEETDKCANSLSLYLSRYEWITSLLNSRWMLFVVSPRRLQTRSYAFQTKSAQLKRSLWWKNTKLWCCILGIFLLIVAVIVVILLIYFGVVKKSF